MEQIESCTSATWPSRLAYSVTVEVDMKAVTMKATQNITVLPNITTQHILLLIMSIRAVIIHVKSNIFCAFLPFLKFIIHMQFECLFGGFAFLL